MDQERRAAMELSGEDRDRLVRIETHSENTAKFLKDHEARIRVVENKQTKLLASHAGIWSVITAVAGFLGYKVS